MLKRALATDPNLAIFAVVNYKTCGWCKKFRPVLEQNLKAMNERAQSRFKVLELDTAEGKEAAQNLGFSGGIPCVIATKGDTEVYRKAGYQETKAFANTLFTLFSTYG